MVVKSKRISPRAEKQALISAFLFLLCTYNDRREVAFVKQSPARIFIIAFGIVVSSSCCAQGSVSSDLSYSAGNIWGFDESSWRYNNELRYNEESYWRFELDDSRYLSIIRPSIFNGDLTKNDILGTNSSRRRPPSTTICLARKAAGPFTPPKTAKPTISSSPPRAIKGSFIFTKSMRRSRPNCFWILLSRPIGRRRESAWAKRPFSSMTS